MTAPNAPDLLVVGWRRQPAQASRSAQAERARVFTQHLLRSVYELPALAGAEEDAGEGGGETRPRPTL